MTFSIFLFVFIAAVIILLLQLLSVGSLYYLKTRGQIFKKEAWREVSFMWQSMSICMFLGYILQTLFGKIDHWRQIYLQTSSTFLYIKRSVSPK